MKKLSIISLFLLLGFVLGSCNKDKAGYTVKDLVGKYTFSNAADAFDGLEEDDFHFLCDDAVVTIAKDKKHGTSLKIDCPEERFSHCFYGSLFENGNDSIIYMSDCGDCKNPPNCYDLTAYVGREDGKIRLIGCFVSTSGMDGISFKCYFDVKKD